MNKKCGMSRCRFATSLAVIAPLLLTFATASHAQTAPGSALQIDVAGVGSYVSAIAANSAGTYSLYGGGGSAAFHLTNHFSIVADVGIDHFTGLPPALSSTMYTYLAGPRYTARRVRRFVPFAQALLGGGRLNANSGGIHAGENAFVMAIGGGVDLPLAGRLSIRLIQADYLLTRFDRNFGSSATQNDVRVSAGVVFRFGHQ